jgi:hypothetical protein
MELNTMSLAGALDVEGHMMLKLDEEKTTGSPLLWSPSISSVSERAGSKAMQRFSTTAWHWCCSSSFLNDGGGRHDGPPSSMVVGSYLSLVGSDPGSEFFLFLNADFWCRFT